MVSPSGGRSTEAGAPSGGRSTEAGSSSRRGVGVDFGSKRIGIAICDAGGLVATPHETIKRVGDESVEHGRIAEIVEQIGAVVVVVGLPIDLDGERGPAARQVENETRRLTKRLTKRAVERAPNTETDRQPVEVVLHDERLTTVTADRSLREQSGGRVPKSASSRAHRKAVIDQLAAATILQSWLDGQA